MVHCGSWSVFTFQWFDVWFIMVAVGYGTVPEAHSVLLQDNVYRVKCLLWWMQWANHFKVKLWFMLFNKCSLYPVYTVHGKESLLLNVCLDDMGGWGVAT